MRSHLFLVWMAYSPDSVRDAVVDPPDLTGDPSTEASDEALLSKIDERGGDSSRSIETEQVPDSEE